MLLVGDLLAVQANDGTLLVDGQVRHTAPRELSLYFAGGSNIDPATLAGGIQITASGRDGIFTNGNETDIIPGFIGLGDTANVAVIRFAEPLPDDFYRLEILGTGATPLASTTGEPFNDGQSDEVIDFRLDLGAQVIAVVPQPIVRQLNGALAQNFNQIVVYFNNDPLNPSQAADPAFYQLVRTAGTLTGDDDTILLPQNVVYDGAKNTATLTFAAPLNMELYRLRVGVSPGVDNTLATAHKLGALYNTANDFSATGFTGDGNGGSGNVNDVDLYRFEIAVGTTANVRVSPVAGHNTTVRLFNSTGAEIAIGDNGAAGSADTLSQVLAAGSYFVGVTSSGNNAYNPVNGGGAAGGGTTGSYLLEIDVAAALNVSNDNNSSLATATPIGALGAFEQVIQAQIERQLIPLRPEAGGLDEPGHRHIPPEAHFGSTDVDPQTPNAIGIRTYSFDTTTSYGVDPQGNALFSAITEEQKQRAREIFEIYASHLGVEFVEIPNGPSASAWVITGDIRAVAPTFPPTGPAGIASGNRVIMNSFINWPSDSPFGGGWFSTAFHEIGHNLGVGHSYDIPSNMGGGLPAENVHPGDHDLVHLRRLWRADANDVDLYHFTLDRPGRFSAETVAERLAPTSYLNSALILFDANGKIVAQNDDYFSNDSFLDLDLPAGTYFLGVSSTGNTNYDPNVSHSGGPGTTDGRYDLKLNFVPVDATEPLTDVTGTPLDGDADRRLGGAFDFWFEGNTPASTIYVDKAADVNGGAVDGNGTLASPYDEIDFALGQAAAQAAATGQRRVVRIVGNGGTDNNLATAANNRPYLIGRVGSTDLTDGGNLLVPKDVTVMIDAGAILKFNRARVDVGTSTLGSDRSNGALQVLGTPNQSVFFTSYHQDALGGDSDALTPAPPAPGDWGGVIFRQDAGYREDDRPTAPPQSGVFLNSINHAQITFGGGRVTINSVDVPVSPIEMLDSRPAVWFNTITNNNEAAVSATPDSFDDRLGRIGPDVHGNLISGNSINGLFVQIETQANQPVDRLEKFGRFDDTDIVHVINENLIINGEAGGPFSASNIASLATARTDGRLKIDPGITVKLQGSRIEAEFGATLLAEGTAADPIVFTSLKDDRYGFGDLFDTNNNASATAAAPGDWSGLVFRPVAVGAVDHAQINFAGGSSAIPGRFDLFNPIEIHQAQVRVANSRLENNAGGASATDRGGLGTNRPAAIFIRGAQPIVVHNIIQNNAGHALSINANAMQSRGVGDPGRSTGHQFGNESDLFEELGDNHGPLVRLNRLGNNTFNGMEVRAEELTTDTVWDDTDIVHIVRGEVVVNNHHTFSGLRLQSSETESLVVKLLGANAGFTANGVALDIDDRIGGTVQVVGAPGHPVVLTSLNDCTIGAGFDQQGLPQVNTIACGAAGAQPGDWRSIRLDKLSNDRNVGIVLEREQAFTDGNDQNGDRFDAQFLGQLARDEKAGDDVLRLGFQVEGFIALDDPTDADVYSFEAQGGSEVWFDIDRTSHRLDSVLELIDGDGVVIASSNNGVFSGGALDVVKDPVLGGDFYTSNRHGAGLVYDEQFRVTLPGSPNVRQNYFIRVRSAGGLSRGEYQLNIRLRQVDNLAGSTVRYADIRYATNGVEVLGLPHHSPLLGESAEPPSDVTDGNGNANALPLGNLLTTDRNTLSVGGALSNANDVDWYRFELGYDLIQSIGGVNGGPKSWATVFDIDYADGLARPDAILSVFDEQGRLILVGRDSDIDDDQPAPGQGTDSDDLSRGSFGKLDPYIGSVQMPAAAPGSTFVYYVAISSNARLPQALNATFQAGALNPLIRLEPVNSVRRVVEDHIGFTGYSSGDPLFGTTQINPVAGPLFNVANQLQLQANVKPFTLSDIQVYVARATELFSHNPFTGALRYRVGGLGGNNTQDLLMRADGRLFAAESRTGQNTAGGLSEIDPSTGAETNIGNDSIPDFDPNTNPPDPQQLSSAFADAIAGIYDRDIPGFNDDRFYYAIRGAHRIPPNQNITSGTSTLYRANPANGAATVVQGEPWGRVGEIFFNTPGDVGETRGMAFLNGQLYGVSNTGRFYRISEGSGRASNVVNLGQPFTGLAAGPQNVENGAFRNLLFAITGSGQIFAINPNTLSLEPIFSSATVNETQTITITGGPPTSGTFTLEFGLGSGQITLPIRFDAPASVDVNELQQLVITGGPTGGTFELQFMGDTTLPIDFNAPASASVDEIQVITISGTPTGGTFDLRFNNSNVVGIPFNATAAQIETELVNQHPDINPGDIMVAGGALPGAAVTITFSGGIFQGENVTPITVAANNLTGGTAPNVTVTTQRQGQASVQKRLEALTTIDPGDVVVLGGPLPGAGVGNPVTIEFAGQYAGVDVPALAPVNENFSGGALPDATITTLAEGNASIRRRLEELPGINPGDVFVSGGPLPGTPIVVQFVGQFAGGNPPNLVLNTNNLNNGAGVNITIGSTGGGGGGAIFASTGVSGATGLAFSTLDFNLWHPTFRRSGDAGHGVNPAFDNSRNGRDRVINTGSESVDYNEGGGISFYFGLEEDVGAPLDFPNSTGDAQFGILSEDYQRDLVSNPNIGNNYNLPGGAHGTLTTNSFSLAGYDTTDKPTLYFNYFLETEGRNGTDMNMRDAARVMISPDNGANWFLLATNNSTLSSPTDLGDAELPHFLSDSREIDNASPNQRVQELFDNTGVWRQARVDLADFVGQPNLRLRFDFVTSGTMAGPTGLAADPTLRFSQFGNLQTNNNERGLNNNFEGFYIDDIIVGFAERGEMVTAAQPGQTAFFNVPVNNRFSPPQQSLIGPYQLEIRRGSEYIFDQDGVLGNPFLPVTPGTRISTGRLIDTNDRLIIQNGRLGDRNVEREQGHIQIENNLISNPAQFGVLVDAGARDSSGSLPHMGSSRNTVVLNNQRLAPGVTVVNNVIFNLGQGGVHFSGDPNAGNSPLAAVPFGRVLNNTIFGGQVGIRVSDNASPTVLNNVLAEVDTGIQVVGSGFAPPVANFNLFSEVQTPGLQGPDDFVLAPGAPLFLDPANRNFVLRPNVVAIDSSINSLEDRAGFVGVKTPLGIAQSVIRAPDFDVYGQRRIDIAGIDPTGQGSQVFKDRGAIEAADVDRPFAVILNPADNDAAGRDIDLGRTFVHLREGLVERFQILLGDGQGPEFPFRGTGINEATVISAAVVVRQDGRILEEGVDYTFGYNATSNIIELTPLSSIWNPNSLFTITLNNGADLGTPPIADLTGNPIGPNRPDLTTQFTIVMPGVNLDYGDNPPPYPTLLSQNGARHAILGDNPLRLGSQVDGNADGAPGLGSTGDNNDFSVDLGDSRLTRTALPPYIVQVPATGGAGIADGERFSIDIGSGPVSFEFNSGGGFLADVEIPFSAGDSAGAIADAMVIAIRSAVAQLGLEPVNLGAGQVLIGGTAGDVVDLSTAPGLTFPPNLPLALRTPGAGISLQLPETVQLRVPATGGAAIIDGRTFSLGLGAAVVVFEFDRNMVTATGNVPVRYTTSDNQDQVAAAIIAAIQNTPLLGLTPSYLGDGLIHLGTSANHTVNVGNSGLAMTGQPGSVAEGNTFVINNGTTSFTFEFDNTQVNNGVAMGNIEIDFSPGQTRTTIAQTIVAAINGAAGLGVTATHLGPFPGGGGLIDLDGTTSAFTIDFSGTPELDVNGELGGVSDGDTFTLHTDAEDVVFEFDRNNSVALGNRPVALNVGDNAAQVADALLDAFNLLGDQMPRFDVNPVNVGGGVVTLDRNDEDGVRLTRNADGSAQAVLNEHVNTQFEIVASGEGFLNAWIDYNHDGDWDDVGEHIFVNLMLMPGVNAGPSLVTRVPLGSATGLTYARFRFSTVQGLSPTGLAEDGEVEDYVFNVVSNQPPTAVDDNNFATNEDTAATIAPLANDQDPDTDPAQLVVVTVNGQAAVVGQTITLPSGARLGLNADGTFLYDPTTSAVFNALAATESSQDTFTYRISDQSVLGGLVSNEATVRIRVDGRNDNPTARDNDYSTDEDTAIAGNVLTDNTGDGADSDPDVNGLPPDDTLVVSAINGNTAAIGAAFTLPSGARITAQANGSFSYDPLGAFDQLAAGDTATDQFTYTASDGNGGQGVATVVVTVTGVNDAPVAQTVLGAAVEDGPAVTFPFNADDPDDDDDSTTLLYTILSQPQEGSALPNGAGGFTFDPGTAFQDLALGETRVVTFTYQATDRHDAVSNVATVSITVTGDNDAPTASDVTADAQEDGAPVSGALLGDDVDSDDDASTLTYAIVDQPSEGSVSNTGAAFTFDPGTAFQDLALGETRIVTFTYRTTDRHGANSALGTGSVTVTGVNDAPVAQDVTGAAQEDGGAVTIAFNADDIDSDNDPTNLVYALLTDPQEGTATINNDGTFQFNPIDQFQDLAMGETRTVTFTYRATDAHSLISNEATITVVVTGVNDAPTAGVVTAAAQEDGAPVSGALVGDDVDSDDDASTLTYAIVDQPSEGSVSNTGATFTFDPGADFQDLAMGETRIVTFTYRTTDRHGANSALGTGSVTVTGVNDAPTASPVSVAAQEDGAAVTMPFGGDDVDSDNSPMDLTYEIVTDLGAGQGSATILLNGQFSYDPENDFQDLALGETRNVTFTYRARDRHGLESNVSTVTVTVTGVNDAPVAGGSQAAAVEDGGPVAAPFNADDVDSDNNQADLVYTILTQPTEGAVTANNDGTFSFDPETDFQNLALGQTRTVTFTYRAADRHGAQSDVATVTVTVTGTNDAPTANPFLTTAIEDGNRVPILATGDDIDSDDNPNTLTFAVDTQPTQGGVVIATASGLEYEPSGALLQTLAQGETRNVTFTYVAIDSHDARSAPATVTVTVTGVNDAPTAGSQNVAAVEDAPPVNASFAGDDVDSDDSQSTLTYTLLSQPSEGTVTNNGNGTFSFDPAGGFQDLRTGQTRQVTFTYRAADGRGAQSGVATITVTVTGVNEPPVAAIDVVSTNRNMAAVFNLAENDTDVDGTINVATIQIVTPPANGVVVVNADGTVQYTPDTDFSGADPFTYTIRDNEGGVSNVATVQVTVLNPANAWQNPLHPLNVNDDRTPQGAHLITVLDALLVVNDLRDNLAITGQVVHELNNPEHMQVAPFRPPFVDPSGDGVVTIGDLLMIVTHLRDQLASGPGPEGEGEGASSTAAAAPTSETHFTASASALTSGARGEEEPSFSPILAAPALDDAAPRPASDRREGFIADFANDDEEEDLEDVLSAIAEDVAGHWSEA